jgi:hypothetical protein
MPFALGSVALGRWFVMNRCFTTHLTCPTSLLLTLYFQQVRAIIKGLACDYVQPNLGSIQKHVTEKSKLPKGPYGPQTQLATSGWGRGFSKVAPHRIPSHPIPPQSIPSPPQHMPQPTPGERSCRPHPLECGWRRVGSTCAVEGTSYYLLLTTY